MPTPFDDPWEWFTSGRKDLTGRCKFSFALKGRSDSQHYEKGRSDSQHYEKSRLILELCKKIINTNDFTDDQKKQFKNIVETARPIDTPNSGTFISEEQARHEREQIEIARNKGKTIPPRHFLNEDEAIKLPDGKKVFLSSQWGVEKKNGVIVKKSFMLFLDLLRNFKDENGKYIVVVQCVQEGEEKVMSNNSDQNQNKTLYPRQIIYFGAPGTSKSYTLNKDAEKIANQERVTFYPGYSYQQFVGTYKPCMVKSKDEDKGEGKDKIAYKFVPGPLLRLLEKALKTEKAEKAEKAETQDKNKEDTSAAEPSTENQENGKEEKNTEKFLLIVEELNRAEAAAVFGDLFQLLDRNSDGSSEYPISVSEDLKQYLEKQGVWKKEAEDTQKKLYFPSNFYIWATMNSADQGVFPLDTAFKRRWDFKYFGIDDAADKLRNDKQKFWNNLRTTINDALKEKLNLNEDKLLGPFFMKVEENIDEQTFWKRFCSKVLLYLYEDAARLKRSQIFKYKTYSEIYNAFEKFDSMKTLQETWNDVFFFECKPAGNYPWAKAETEEDTPSGSEADDNETTEKTVTENSDEMNDEQ